MRINLLHVEDRVEEAKFVEMMLRRSPDITFNIDHVCTAAEASNRLELETYDLVVFDLGLPDSDGVTAVKHVSTAHPSTPIFVLSGDDRHDVAVAAIEAGAQDFLPKQHLAGQLLTRMAAMSIARQKRLRTAELASLTDSLTGIGNRRAGDHAFERRQRGRVGDSPVFGLAMIDIDRFKSINDLYGHDVGDEVIREVAFKLSAASDPDWDVCRHGGEEFTVLFSSSSIEETNSIADRLQSSCTFSHGVDPAARITASCGATLVEHDDTFRSASKRADSALYASKQGGRCRSFIHDGESIHPVTRVDASPFAFAPSADTTATVAFRQDQSKV
ncbi:MULTISPECIES: GGDEF domain-containing response regulator [Rhodopirellula]|uniref:GGDEF domain-containing response regulator n=1 Tax=Rhodopirellula TaxID=265488 RepID=UPI00257D0BB5|nr:diguanylate cyclase [Rhodopirellula sp. UBA1907]|tara:strand:- start:17 stop:1009 length:993 start_codon:yes stop_codon:yes gene_type:complete